MLNYLPSGSDGSDIRKEGSSSSSTQLKKSSSIKKLKRALESIKAQKIGAMNVAKQINQLNRARVSSDELPEVLIDQDDAEVAVRKGGPIHNYLQMKEKTRDIGDRRFMLVLAKDLLAAIEETGGAFERALARERANQARVSEEKMKSEIEKLSDGQKTSSRPRYPPTLEEIIEDINGERGSRNPERRQEIRDKWKEGHEPQDAREDILHRISQRQNILEQQNAQLEEERQRIDRENERKRREEQDLQRAIRESMEMQLASGQGNNKYWMQSIRALDLREARADSFLPKQPAAAFFGNIGPPVPEPAPFMLWDPSAGPAVVPALPQALMAGLPRQCVASLEPPPPPARDPSTKPVKLPDAWPDEPKIDKSSISCTVCMERRIATSIKECGHCILCVHCAREIGSKPLPVCPKCREPIKKISRARIEVDE